MNKPIDAQLSAELQELYLENKEWLSDILFLEDEMRFFQNLFGEVLSTKVQHPDVQKVAAVSAGLETLLDRRRKLQIILDGRKHQLEQLLDGSLVHIGIELIEADSAIVKEIKLLLAADKLIKNELFVLIEELKAKERPIGITTPLKINRYPTF